MLGGNLDIQHIPYKGAGPVVIDLVAGHIQLASMGLPSAMAMVQAGKLRPLAVTTAKRSGFVPELPTLHESGLGGFDMTTWWGVMAPAGV